MGLWVSLKQPKSGTTRKKEKNSPMWQHKGFGGVRYCYAIHQVNRAVMGVSFFFEGTGPRKFFFVFLWLPFKPPKQGSLEICPPH